MKKYSRIPTFVLVALCCRPSFIHAHLRFGPLVGDNMVVQQQTDVRLWGWTDKGSGTVVTLRTSWNKNKQKVNNIGKAGKTVTLYAVWAKETYKVVFDASGGRGKMPAQTFKYGQTQKLASNKFTRKGYVFGGWAIRDPLATIPKIAYKNGQAVKNLSSNGATVKLYAVWTKK